LDFSWRIGVEINAIYGKDAWIKRTEKLALEWYREQKFYNHGDEKE
jgi:hypothetical protein